MQSAKLGTREQVTTSVTEVFIEIHDTSVLLRVVELDSRRQQCLTLSREEVGELVKQVTTAWGLK